MHAYTHEHTTTSTPKAYRVAAAAVAAAAAATTTTTAYTEVAYFTRHFIYSRNILLIEVDGTVRLFFCGRLHIYVDLYVEV